MITVYYVSTEAISPFLVWGLISPPGSVQSPQGWLDLNFSIGARMHNTVCLSYYYYSIEIFYISKVPVLVKQELISADNSKLMLSNV